MTIAEILSEKFSVGGRRHRKSRRKTRRKSRKRKTAKKSRKTKKKLQTKQKKRLRKYTERIGGPKWTTIANAQLKYNQIVKGLKS